MYIEMNMGVRMHDEHICTDGMHAYVPYVCAYMHVWVGFNRGTWLNYASVYMRAHTCTHVENVVKAPMLRQ
jgi:hypothetical protein